MRGLGVTGGVRVMWSVPASTLSRPKRTEPDGSAC
jgi:hypothetical protein